MTETTVFPKGLSGTLDIKDKILTIYQKGDLKEVICLRGLENEWNEMRIGDSDWDLNLWAEGNKWYLSIYSIDEFNEERLTDMYNFKKIEKFEVI